MTVAQPEATGRLSETMVCVLRLASVGSSLYTYCANRAEHGARTGSIYALRRRGLLDGAQITEAGKAALAKAQARRTRRTS